MTQLPQWTRRDRRLELAPGTAFVEFEFAGSDGHHRRGEVESVSTTGLGFILDADPGVGVGTILVAASVHTSDGLIEGDLSVRSCRPKDHGRIEFGCLFYPASLEDSTRWMAFADGRSGVSGSSTHHLPIRCSNCQGAVWISDDGQKTCHCPACSQEYSFGRRIRGRQLEELRQRARRMATELGIDLPSAASMLLGILTLAEVRDALGDIRSTKPSAPSSGAGRERGIDPAFGPAIEARTLTRAQAVQRGSREAYATGLVARHRVSLDEAYDVADNRASLLSVMRQRSAGTTVIARPERPVSSGHWTTVAVLPVIVLLAVLGIVRQLDGSTDRVAPAPQPRPIDQEVPRPDAAGFIDTRLPTPSPVVEVHFDPNGQRTRIRASRPQTVLLAYCEKVGREPLALATGMMPDSNLWLGIHHDKAFGDRRAIAIRKDRTTGRWTAGDGTSPIPAWALDPAQLGTTHELATGSTR